MKDYSDIINLKYPFPSNHIKMPRMNRAAQFAPFAALTGYNEMVNLSSIEKNKEIILDENKIEEMDKKISLVASNLNSRIFIKVTYYHLGEYKIKTGIVINIDKVLKEMIFDDDEKIKISEIVDIASDLFSLSSTSQEI